MPEPLWIYLMALLYFTHMTTCSAIADAFDSVSHDRLTRMLQGTWSGHTLLDLALRLLFTVTGGSLIVDDTVVARRCSKGVDPVLDYHPKLVAIDEEANNQIVHRRCFGKATH
jgi:hypothetical protein